MTSAELNGKVAWVTGGGSGIGLAGAIELTKAGAQVIISGRTAKTLKDAESALREVGNGEAIVLDVADQSAVSKVAVEIEKRYGQIDILINSAGLNLPQRSFLDVSIEGWDQVMAINLSGSFYCCQAVLPGMRERQGGLIINVSSWAGRNASGLTGPAYNAAKRGLIAMTESITIEECQNGIRATSILPGEVATPIMEKRPIPPSQEERARMAQTEDLGKAILFVASMPARTCINEMIIAPTWNRFFLGGLETP